MPPDDQNEKWELPERLRISNPDVLARAEAMRIELATRVESPFGHLSPHEQERANAAVMVEHLKKDLERVRLQVTEILTVDGEAPPQLQELQDARHHIAARLAEAYASIGRFDLAADIEPREETRTEYVEILEAINRPDDEWCECGPGRDHVLREVFSLKHGRMISVRRCSGCKKLNATALPAHIAEQRAHRAKTGQMVAGKSPEEAKAILTAQGHTSEKLLKK